MSRETLWKWLIEAKVWRARYGELLQWDTTKLDWLKERDEKLYLIGMIKRASLDSLERLQVGRCEWMRRVFICLSPAKPIAVSLKRLSGSPEEL